MSKLKAVAPKTAEPRELPSQKFLNHLFNFDTKTGILTWAFNRSSNARQDQEAGSTDSKGYRFVRINKIAFRSHRVIWKMTFGSDPKGHIDHVNGDKSDNRLINLRVVSHQENLKNSKIRSDNTSGTTGISFNEKRLKWRAYVHIDGKMKELGSFLSKWDAIKCRKKFAKENGFHINHGRKQNV